MTPSVIFFGSFGHYSALVLEALIKSKFITVSHVVTTPPFINRKKKLEQNTTQKLAKENNIPTTTEMPTQLADINQNLKTDFIITAGYGKLLPSKLLNEAKIGSLNLHFSLLPKYRGANPGEWAILMGEKETGITVIEMNDKFDQGGILYFQSIPILKTDNRETIYAKLYKLGGQALPQIIVDFATKKIRPKKQPTTNFPYASRLKKDDGFIDWTSIKKAMKGETFPPDSLSKTIKKIIKLQNKESIDANFIEKMSRALYGFPSLWTLIPTAKGQKRMKIFNTEIKLGKLALKEVQIEGQTKAQWNQVKNILKQ